MSELLSLSHAFSGIKTPGYVSQATSSPLLEYRKFPVVMLGLFAAPAEDLFTQVAIFVPLLGLSFVSPSQSISLPSSHIFGESSKGENGHDA